MIADERTTRCDPSAPSVLLPVSASEHRPHIYAQPIADALSKALPSEPKLIKAESSSPARYEDVSDADLATEREATAGTIASLSSADAALVQPAAGAPAAAPLTLRSSPNTSATAALLALRPAAEEPTSTPAVPAATDTVPAAVKAASTPTGISRPPARRRLTANHDELSFVAINARTGVRPLFERKSSVLATLPDYRPLLSTNAFRNVLSEEEREKLLALLPAVDRSGPELDALLSGRNNIFNSSTRDYAMMLRSGSFEPATVARIAKTRSKHWVVSLMRTLWPTPGEAQPDTDEDEESADEESPALDYKEVVLKAMARKGERYIPAIAASPPPSLSTPASSTPAKSKSPKRTATHAPRRSPPEEKLIKATGSKRKKAKVSSEGTLGKVSREPRCHRCREKHLQCNRNQPCQNCLKDPNVCTYPSPSVPRNQAEPLADPLPVALSGSDTEPSAADSGSEQEEDSPPSLTAANSPVVANQPAPLTHHALHEFATPCTVCRKKKKLCSRSLPCTTCAKSSLVCEYRPAKRQLSKRRALAKDSAALNPAAVEDPTSESVSDHTEYVPPISPATTVAPTSPHESPSTTPASNREAPPAPVATTLELSLPEECVSRLASPPGPPQPLRCLPCKVFHTTCDGEQPACARCIAAGYECRYEEDHLLPSQLPSKRRSLKRLPVAPAPSRTSVPLALSRRRRRKLTAHLCLLNEPLPGLDPIAIRRSDTVSALASSASDSALHSSVPLPSEATGAVSSTLEPSSVNTPYSAPHTPAHRPGKVSTHELGPDSVTEPSAIETAALPSALSAAVTSP